jgi:hypothetical protein
LEVADIEDIELAVEGSSWRLRAHRVEAPQGLTQLRDGELILEEPDPPSSRDLAHVEADSSQEQDERLRRRLREADGHDDAPGASRDLPETSPWSPAIDGRLRRSWYRISRRRSWS